MRAVVDVIGLTGREQAIFVVRSALHTAEAQIHEEQESNTVSSAVWPDGIGEIMRA